MANLCKSVWCGVFDVFLSHQVPLVINMYLVLTRCGCVFDTFLVLRHHQVNLIVIFSGTWYTGIKHTVIRGIRSVVIKQLLREPYIVFTELANTMKCGEGSYITLFSPSDVTAFHRMKYGEGGVI